MEELNKIKELFNDFIKEADKFVSEQRIKQVIQVKQVSEKIIYWGETAEEKINWHKAKAWCEKQGGRLPTLEELEKAYEDKVSGFDYEGFYWTSTPYYDGAYYVKFSDGYSYGGVDTYFVYSVRCVYDK